MAEPTTATGDAARSNTSGESHTTAPSTGGIVDKVRERAAAQLTAQKDRAFEGIGSVAQAVRQSTQQLRDHRHETLAGYVEQTADQIGRFAEQLRQKDLSELLADAQRLARRQPAIFIGSAFALGLCGARFLKSSTQHDEDDPDGHDDRSRRGSYRYPGGEQRQQYGGGSTRGIQRSTSQSGVSPDTSSMPVASGSTYASASEPYPSPSAAGARADDGATAGASSSRTTGNSRERSGDRPGSGGSSPTRPRRPATDTERS